MTRPVHYDPAEVRRRFIDSIEASVEQARKRATTDGDRAFIEMQVALREPLADIVAIFVQWHNQEQPDEDRGRAAGAMCGIIAKNLLSNSPASGDAFFKSFTSTLNLEQGDDGECITTHGKMSGVIGGNA